MATGEDIGTGKEQAAGGQDPSAPPPGAQLETDASLVAFTIDPNTARLVKLERVDSAGARQELSEADTARLESRTDKMTLETIVEQAFEAGLACLLEDGAAEPEPPETEEEAVLRRVLLRPLMAESGAKRLIQSELLSWAMLGTLLRHAAHARRNAGERGSAQ